MHRVKNVLVSGISASARLLPLPKLAKVRIRRVRDLDHARRYFQAYVECKGSYPDPPLFLEQGVTAYTIELHGKIVSGFAHCNPPRRAHLASPNPEQWSWEGWEEALEVSCLFVRPEYRRSWLSSLTWLGALSPCALYPRSVAGALEPKLAKIYKRYGGQQPHGPWLFVWTQDEVRRQLSGRAMRYIFGWRYLIRVPVELSYTGHAESTFTHNLSLGGVFLQTRQNIPTGSILNLRFSLPLNEEPVITEARVKWVEQEKGVGVQFISLKPKHAWSLLKLLAHYRTPSADKVPKSAKSVHH